MPCSGASELLATIPAADLVTAGTAKIAVSNPPSTGGGTSNSLTFAVTKPVSGTTWVRTVSGITAPNDIAWDPSHGKLYVSAGATDPVHPNTIAGH